ncbi:PREDICTED: pentatricopeptide repeat-containing protein At1g62910-like [Tarenaya hassleriana]|uniref:pentatricopeptide repeat-containing protein At1g62910-like n=1 Tax=Tarenaya hassleriana TaxID=28532 RepID=UPI0008FD93E5|nr:PREDICTED: pentatricopeptide repeat-containing protein At1g62910-like [Tarenaya hassleriana]
MSRIMGARSLSSDSCRSLSSRSSLFQRSSAQIPSEFERQVRRVCKSGELNLEGALFYFDKLIETRPIPSIDTFNHVLGSVSKLRAYSEVLSMYKKIRYEGANSDLYTSNIVINAFCHLRKIDYGIGVLGDIMKRGLEANSVTVATLVKGLCSEGKVFDAVQVFDKMSKSGFREDRGCEASARSSYVLIIHSLVKNCSVDRAMVVFRKMIDNGFAPGVIVFGNLINGLSSSGRLREALELFDEMVTRGISPDVIIYSSLIRGYCKLGMWGEVAKTIQKMAREGVSPNVYTYNILIDSLCKVKEVNEAIEVFESMLDQGIEPNIYIYNSLLTGLFTVKRSNDAAELFVSLRQGNLRPDVVTYSTMIVGYFKHGETKEALKLLREMIQEGLKPDEFTYTILIHYASQSGDLQAAQGIFDSAYKSGQSQVLVSSPSCGALLNGLIKNGKLEEARIKFDEILGLGLVPDVVTYNIMLHGLCKSKKLSEARELLVDMEAKGCSPDAISFNTVIWGFLKGGEIEDAVQLLESMLERNFSPDKGIKSKLSRILADSKGCRTLQALVDVYGKEMFE